LAAKDTKKDPVSIFVSVPFATKREISSESEPQPDLQLRRYPAAEQ
jgi:hypothetical protein